jgi:hypothetical protein
VHTKRSSHLAVCLNRQEATPFTRTLPGCNDRYPNYFSRVHTGGRPTPMEAVDSGVVLSRRGEDGGRPDVPKS